MRRLWLIAAASALAAPTYANPVIAGDHPDPTIVKAPDAYYASATTSAWAPVFPIFRSRDLVTWRQVGAVLRTTPRWASGKFWAPELAHEPGRFLAYWGAARHGGRPCIALSTAARAEGPWRYRGRVTCPRRGAIDAAPFRDRDGSRWLLYKAFGPGGGIMLQALTRDDLRVRGRAHTLIEPDAQWEQGVTEGPALLHAGGRYILLYSGGHCCRPPCSYAVGVARAPSLLGPYRKYGGNPILRGNDAWKCPGHGSVAPAGATGMVFLHHAFRTEDATDLRRQVLLEPLAIGPDGWPAIGAASGAATVGESPLGAIQSPPADGFLDRFGAGLRPGWEWLFDARPSVHVARGAMTLRCGRRLSFVARQVPVDRFTVIASVRPGRGNAAVGLAVNTNRGVRGIEIRRGRARAFVASPLREATGPSVPVGRHRRVALIITVAPGGYLATYVRRDATGPLVRVPAAAAAMGAPPTRVALTCRLRGSARFGYVKAQAG
jgi:GH43 family beta-xylosidase